jgi:hypothetical protein
MLMIQDDLEMVVQSVFHSCHMLVFCQIEQEQDAVWLGEFWVHHLKPKVWNDMVKLTILPDYAALKTAIADVLAPPF